MSLHDVSLSQNAVDVAVTILRMKKPVALLSVLCHDMVVLFEWDITAKPSKPPVLKWATSLPLHDSPYILNQQVMFGGKESISILSSDGSNSFLHFLKVDSGLAEKDLSISDDDVRGLFNPIAKANSITPLLLTKTAVIEPSPLQGSNMRRLKIFPHSSPRVEVMGIYNETMQLEHGLNGNGQNLLNNLIVFGLADEGTLFANERVIARNCKSFLITSTHLIFTTGQHLLKFVHITKVEGELRSSCRYIQFN